jgi:hypothetical protein
MVFFLVVFFAPFFLFHTFASLEGITHSFENITLSLHTHTYSNSSLAE